MQVLIDDLVHVFSSKFFKQQRFLSFGRFWILRMEFYSTFQFLNDSCLELSYGSYGFGDPSVRNELVYLKITNGILCEKLL